MANRRLRLAGLAAAAVTLTVLAHVLTADSLLGVWAVVEIVGGLAIGRAVIAVFRTVGDSRVRGYVILSFALVPASYGALSANPLGFRAGYGLHGALVGGAVGYLLSGPLVSFLHWLQDLLVQGLALARESLVTPVRLPTWNRLARPAGLTAAAVALTAVANVLTAARLTTGLGVLVVVEIAGGLAIGGAVISQFRYWSSESGRLAADEPLFGRSLSILLFALLGALPGTLAYESLGARVGHGLHGALVGGAVGLLLSFPVGRFIRWYTKAEDEKGEYLAESVAAHEALVTPVRLPTWSRRCMARVLDALLLWGAFQLLYALDAATGADPFLFDDAASEAEVWLSILVVWALYDIVFHPLFGATAGKALCRIRVVDAGGAARVGVLRAAGRWALGVVNAPLFWTQQVLPADLLWSIDPRLSAVKPVYCGTIVITAAERHRLRGLTAVERAAELAETFRAVRAIPAQLSRRRALGLLALLVAVGGFVIWASIEYPCEMPHPAGEPPVGCVD